MEIASNLILSGLSSGTIYGLIALSIILIFKTTFVINFAVGNMGMVMAFLCLSLLSSNVPYIVSVSITLLVSALFGVVIQRGILYYVNLTTEKKLLRYVKGYLRGGYPLPMTLATLGLALILEGFAGQIYGTDTKPFPPLLEGPPIQFRGIIAGRQEIVSIVFTIIVFLVLFFILKKTKIGVASRAVADDTYASQLMGININNVYIFIWGISGFLTGLSAILVAPRFSLDINMMIPVQLKAFSAVVLGGFESILGAIIGGVILGVAENLVGYYISSALKDIIAIIVIVIVLLFIPEGIFGRRKIKKV